MSSANPTKREEIDVSGIASPPSPAMQCEEAMDENVSDEGRHA